MSSIKTTKELIVIGRNSGVVPWLWGSAGVGKSAIVKQVADELKIDFIDVRAALTEAGDWLGLPVESKDPKTGESKAKFLMSSFLPTDANWKGILFLDEANRSRSDVQNCLFQLILDGKIQNHYTLPKGASIVIAGNPSGGDYQVTEVDPALLKRVMHVHVTPTRDEWFAYAKKTGVDTNIIDFHNNVARMLDDTQDSKLGFNFELVKPCRRGWDLFNRVFVEMKNRNSLDQCLLDAACGLVGTEAATQFQQFLKTNYTTIETAKILDDYKSIKKTVKKLVKDGKIPEQKQAIEELFDKYITAKTSEDQLKNVIEFLLDIAPDTAHVGITRMTLEHKEHIKRVLLWGKEKKDKEKTKLATDMYELVQEMSKINENKKDKA